MTNYLAIVWLAWATNTVSPGGDGPRGHTWLATNIVSAVVAVPVPGVGNVTNTVPVQTNITRFTIMQTDASGPHRLPREEADKRGLPPITKK